MTDIQFHIDGRTQVEVYVAWDVSTLSLTEDLKSMGIRSCEVAVWNMSIEQSIVTIDGYDGYGYISLYTDNFEDWAIEYEHGAVYEGVKSADIPPKILELLEPLHD